MDRLLVICNHCGSSLQIDEEIAFVTCRNCQTTLEVVRTFNSVYTKVREKQTWEKPAEIVYQSKEIDKTTIFKQIEMLDNEWQNQLPTFMKKGTLPDQNIAISVIFSLIGAIFVLSGMSRASSMGAPLIFPLFGVGMLGLLIFNLFDSSSKHEKYKTAKANYERKRATLMESLNR
jgi:hypothetical protein